MMPAPRSRPRRRIVWLGIVVLLVALRVPAFVQPLGGDQALYTYIGERVAQGGVPYRDAWDQKPPAIHVLYAALWSIWPAPAVVAAADLAAAALTAWLIVVLCRRRFGELTGYLAASLFLVFSHPEMTRVGGIYLRGQCETFISPAIAGALVLIAGERRRWPHALAAGALLGLAVWLKYNAAVYALPLAIAAFAWRGSSDEHANLPPVRALVWCAAGAIAVSVLFVGYFAAHGALTDLRLATIDYNLRYSGERYEGFVPTISYLIAHAKVDLLWFLAGIGILELGAPRRRGPSGPRMAAGPRPGGSENLPSGSAGIGDLFVLIGWALAALASIAVNGHQLPQYFLQAAPVMAVIAGAGLVAARALPRWGRIVVVAAVAIGAWRVGDEPTGWRPRLGGTPELAGNLSADLAAWTGSLDRQTYLARFRGPKYDAVEIEDVAAGIRQTTDPREPIFVFGFSGGSIDVASRRVSSSRFFWSRPVLIEFEAGRPGYGSSGLLADLQRRPPSVVVLQEEDEADWRSRSFFLNQPMLRTWLEAGYRLDRETRTFSIWRRRS